MSIDWDNLEGNVSVKEPSSPREARRLIEEQLRGIKAIERQLADRNITDKKGRRLSNTKYHRWRRNALRALSAYQIALRYYRAWLNKELARREALRFDVNPENCDDLLAASYNLLREWAHEVQVMPEEAALLDVVRTYLTGMDYLPEQVNRSS